MTARNPRQNIRLPWLLVGFIALFLRLPLFAGQMSAATQVPASRLLIRHVAQGEDWEMREGRFYRNGEWVFIKTGKLLRAFGDVKTADKVIADIDVLVDRLNFNNFSLNIYPDAFDADGDARIDPVRGEAYTNIGRILDHCWKRGVFYSLSFETYNIGGGGTPASFFAQHPEAIAINALGEKARDHEYTVSDGKLTPSVYHPAYHAWSRAFMRNFLSGLGADRCSRLLFVETTVEPQYPGACRVGDQNPRRAFLDFNEAAHQAFNQQAGKHWAVSEHMSGTGSWGQDDRDMTEILENTLARGTRFGWDLVNAGNRHATDDFHLYDEHWHSQTLDIIDGDNWPKWLEKIGVKPFVPQPR